MSATATTPAQTLLQARAYPEAEGLWYYEPGAYLPYRYILGPAGEKPLICIGINPSTAQPGRLDNTLKSVSRIAAGNGFDSFIMFNVYPQRATDPHDMDAVCNEALVQENLRWLDIVLTQKPGAAVWAAWGTIIGMRPYLPDCLRRMHQVTTSHNIRWYTAGPRSKAGHPHHPLYLRKDSLLVPFDLPAYLADSLAFGTQCNKRPF